MNSSRWDLLIWLTQGSWQGVFEKGGQGIGQEVGLGQLIRDTEHGKVVVVVVVVVCVCVFVCVWALKNLISESVLTALHTTMAILIASSIMA